MSSGCRDSGGESVVVVRLRGHNNVRIECNKKVLCKQSPYFKAMFSRGFAESGQLEVTLDGVQVEALQMLLSNGQLKLSQDNVFEVLQAAGMLQFHEARTQCCAYLIRNHLTSSSLVLQAFCMANLYDELDTQKIALNRILTDLHRTTQLSDYLPTVPAHLLELILSHDNLLVSSELEVLQTLLQWTDGNPKNKQYFSDLLGCIRLSQSQEHCKTDLNSDAMMSQCIAHCPDAKALMYVNKTKRCGPPTVPCVVGRLLDHVAGHQHQLMALLNDQELVPVLDLSPVCRQGDTLAEGFRVTCIGPDVFVIGGEFGLGHSNWNRHIWRYDTLTENWSMLLHELQAPCRHHSVVAVRSKQTDAIVLMGGFGRHRIRLDHVYELNPDTGLSSNWPPLPDAVHSPAVCVFKNRLFVLKGFVWVLHLDRGSWSKMELVQLPSNLEANFAVAAEDYIYFTGSFNSALYRFDPDAEASTEVELVGRFSGEAQNVCLVGQRIYNFSSDTTDGSSSVEAFDLTSGQFNLLWEKQDGARFDFSPSFSHGCFALTRFM